MMIADANANLHPTEASASKTKKLLLVLGGEDEDGLGEDARSARCGVRGSPQIVLSTAMEPAPIGKEETPQSGS